MIDAEFEEWISGYVAAFPDFKSWLTQIPHAAKREMTGLWREALRDIDLRDAKAVTLRIVSGDDESVPAYERELTAARIRCRAKENQSRRSERTRRQNSPAERTEPRGPSARGLYTAIVKLLDDHPDMTSRDAAEQVMPAGGEDSGRRYECPNCLDSGIVLVWSQRSIRSAVQGKLDDPNNRRACGCPCSCRFGDAKIWTGDNPPKHWAGFMSNDVRFTSERYCRCPFANTESQLSIGALKDWAAEKYLAWQNRKRQPAFDEWNERVAP